MTSSLVQTLLAGAHGSAFILEASRDAIVITGPELDEPGPTIEYANGAFERMSGYTRDELIGRTPRLLQGARTSRAELDRLHAELAGTGVFEGEAINYRKDGGEYVVRWSVVAIRDADGRLTNWVSLQREITRELEAADAVARLREAEHSLRTLVEGMPVLVWRSADRGMWTWASPQWLDYTGQSLEQSLGRGWLDAVHPDDRARALKAWEGAEAAERFEVTFRLFGVHGRKHRWFTTRASPVISDGTIVEWLGSSVDVDDIRRLEGQQRMLVSELQHRTRNLIGVISAIATTTLDAGPARDAFAQRLAAIGRAQRMLTSADARLVRLDELVEAELLAHGVAIDQSRVTVDGPDIDLDTHAIQILALALHELATNALKHGALARSEGRLSITWRASERDGRRCVELDWRETGVRLPSDAPRKRGFGLELIERSLPYELQATTSLDFKPDGMYCRIEVPVLGARGDGADQA